MAINLLEMLTRAISPATVKSVADHLGESESGVQSGLALLLPALLGGLASKAATPSGAAGVFASLNGAKVDTDLPGNLGSLLGSGQSSSIASVGSLGSLLLGHVFGADKALGVGTALAGITGMRSGNAGSLVTLAVPVVFGWLKKLIAERGLDASRTAELLIGQRNHLTGHLDPALTRALGLGAPAGLLASLGSTAGAAGNAAAAHGTVAATGGMRWMPWLVGAVMGIGALWHFLGTAGTAPAAVRAPAVLAAPAGDLKLPAKVYFETGKAEIGAEGQALVTAIAGGLDKDRAAQVQITGYTDKTGDAAVNGELAKNRALAVQAALVAAGVGADRIEARPPVFVEVGAGGADAQERRVEISAR
ncbi:MAG: DUF937 domain-containing protein [Pseudomonadota bacterium]